MSFSCSADWIDYGKKLCYACLSSGIFQRVKGLQDSIILVVLLLIAIMKDQVASFEERFVNVSLFAWQDVAVLRCIY